MDGPISCNVSGYYTQKCFLSKTLLRPGWRQCLQYKCTQDCFPVEHYNWTEQCVYAITERSKACAHCLLLRCSDFRKSFRVWRCSIPVYIIYVYCFSYLAITTLLNYWLLSETFLINVIYS